MFEFRALLDVVEHAPVYPARHSPPSPAIMNDDAVGAPYTIHLPRPGTVPDPVRDIRIPGRGGRLDAGALSHDADPTLPHRDRLLLPSPGAYRLEGSA